MVDFLVGWRFHDDIYRNAWRLNVLHERDFLGILSCRVSLPFGNFATDRINEAISHRVIDVDEEVWSRWVFGVGILEDFVQVLDLGHVFIVVLAPDVVAEVVDIDPIVPKRDGTVVHKDGVQSVWKLGGIGELVGKHGLNVLDVLVDRCGREVSMLREVSLTDGKALTLELDLHGLAELVKLIEKLRFDIQTAIALDGSNTLKNSFGITEELSHLKMIVLLRRALACGFMLVSESISYLLSQQLRSTSFEQLEFALPFPTLTATIHHLRLGGIHVPVKVDFLQQVQVVGGLERALLHGVELNALHLNLQDRGNIGDRSVLFGLCIVNADLLHIERAIDGSVYIARPARYIDLDIAPPFLFGSGASCSGDIGSGSTIEETDNCQ